MPRAVTLSSGNKSPPPSENSVGDIRDDDSDGGDNNAEPSEAGPG